MDRTTCTATSAATNYAIAGSLDSNGNYVDTFNVRTNATTSLQSTVNEFFAQYIEPQVSVPEPGSLLLIFIGLPMLLVVRRKRSV